MTYANYATIAALLLTTAGCATSPMPEGGDGTKSTFIEQTEPTISIKPLSLEEQEAQAAAKPGSLAANIKKITPLPIAVVVAAKPVWTMTAGRTVGQELQGWGAKAGWKVIWNMPKDWSVPASTTFSGDFKEVAADVIKTLAANGALVRAQFYDGNKTMIVNGPGVAPQ